MAKPGSPFPGPAGLGEWLPLLGAICQVLASLGDEDETELTEPSEHTESTGTVTAQDRPPGEEHG